MKIKSNIMGKIKKYLTGSDISDEKKKEIKAHLKWRADKLDKIIIGQED